MLLVVDVGNTQTHLGAFRGEELVHDWRFATVRESTADELGAALRNLLALRDLGFDDLDASILSSTVPQLRPEWTAMAERYLGHVMPVVGPGVRTGMPIRMDNPREVGADRLVNSVAAFERVGGPCVIVDFGTAITYDCVSPAGEYVGGIIAPGVEISMEALTSRAAAIPRIDLTPPRALIGKSTVEAIRSGVIFGSFRIDSSLRTCADSTYAALLRCAVRPANRPRPSVEPIAASTRRSTGSSGACARSSARRPRRSPPAASRARSCRSAT